MERRFNITDARVPKRTISDDIVAHIWLLADLGDIEALVTVNFSRALSEADGVPASDVIHWGQRAAALAKSELEELVESYRGRPFSSLDTANTTAHPSEGVELTILFTQLPTGDAREGLI
jgi:hypothetical protein